MITINICRITTLDHDGKEYTKDILLPKYNEVSAAIIAANIVEFIEDGRCPNDAWEESIKLQILMGDIPKMAFYSSVKKFVEETHVSI